MSIRMSRCYFVLATAACIISAQIRPNTPDAPHPSQASALTQEESEATNEQRLLELLEGYRDVLDQHTYQQVVQALAQGISSRAREPRPGQSTIETEPLVPAEDEPEVQYLPKSINIENDLTVGGDTDIQGNLTVQGAAPGSQPIENILQVTQGTPQNNQEFNSIKAAVDSIGTTFPAGERYLVMIAPGEYFEDPFTIPTGTFVFSEDRGGVVIRPNDPNSDFITMQDNTGIKGFTIKGVTGAGKSAIVFSDGGIIGINDIAFGDNDRLVTQPATSVSSVSIMRDVSILPDSNFTLGFVVSSTATDAPALMVSSEMRYSISGTQPLDFVALYDIQGPRSFWVGESISTGTVLGSVPGSNSRICVHIADGSDITIENMIVSGYPTGLSIPNIGAGPKVQVASGLIRNVPAGGNSISIENPLTEAAIRTDLPIDKLNFVNDPRVALSAVDTDTTRSVTIGRRLAGDDTQDITQISDITHYDTSTGVIVHTWNSPQKIEINTPNPGEVRIPAGSGYVADMSTRKIKFVEWSTTVLGPFPSDSRIPVGIENNGVPSINVPNAETHIFLGNVITDSNGDIAFAEQAPRLIHHNNAQVSQVLRRGLSNIIVNGLIVSENTTTDAQLDVTSGRYIYGLNTYEPSGGSPVVWGEYFQDSNNNTALRDEDTTKNTVQAKYNVPGNINPLQSMAGTGDFARHAFYVINDGSDEQYFLVYGQTLYASQVDARNGTIPPRPSLFSENAALIASIIVEEDTSTGDDTANIVEIIDERPQSVGAASQITSVSNHGNLSGLSDDDHPQYLLVSGARAMSGSLDMNGHDLQNVRNLDVNPATGAEGINIGGTTGNAIAINSGGAMTIKGDDGSLNINSGTFLVDGATGDVTAAGTIAAPSTTTSSITTPTGSGNNLSLNPDGSAVDMNNKNLINVGALSLGGNNINNAGTINASTVNTDNLDPNGTSEITLSGPLDTNGNHILDLSGAPLTLDGNGNGVRIASGNDLSVGGGSIINVDTVDGVDVSTHGTRHNPDNTDPVSVASPVAITDSGTASSGTANSFVRSDHVHPHGNLGATDANGNLHDLAVANTSPGFISGSDQAKLDNLASDPDATYVNESGDTMSGSLDLGGNNLTSVNEITATTASISMIDNDGSAITVGDNLNGASALTISTSTGDLTLNPSGAIDAGANNITNVGTVDGVDISSHGIRHNPDNTDPVSVAAPVAITDSATASSGTANSFVRSDHVHPHGNLAESDANGLLHPLATTSAAGFLSSSDKQKLNNLASNADATYVNESGDTMTGTLAFNIGAGVNAINVNSGNATIDDAGNASFGTLSAGATTLSGALDMGSQNITNVAEITATTASVGTLDNDGSAIALGDNIDLNSNTLVDTSGVSDGQLLIGGANNNDLQLQTLTGGNNLTVTSGNNSITLDVDGNVADSFSGDSGTATPSSGSVTIAGGTSITTSASGSTVTVNADGDVANTYNADSGSATPNSNSLTLSGGSNISTSGSGSTVTYDLDSTITDMTEVRFNTGGLISNVNNIDADSNNTINLRSNGNTNVLTIDGANTEIDANNNNIISVDDMSASSFTGGSASLGGALNMNGNNIDNAGTIDTNNNRNLVLNPGSSHRLQFQNIPTQEDNIITLDSSGNIGLSSESSSAVGQKAALGATLSGDVQPVSTQSGNVTYGPGNIQETYFIIPFDQAPVDTESNFDTTNHTYTIPQDGLYFLSLQIAFGSQNGETAVRVVKDSGSGFNLAGDGAVIRDTSGQSTLHVTLTGIYQFNQGDVLRAEIASEGTSMEIQNVASRFSVYRI